MDIKFFYILELFLLIFKCGNQFSTSTLIFSPITALRSCNSFIHKLMGDNIQLFYFISYKFFINCPIRQQIHRVNKYNKKMQTYITRFPAQ